MQNKNDVWKRYRESVLANISASEVYGNIKNQKEGTDGWVTGLCPFHKDTHNSFAYNRDTLAWVCFSPTCGKGSVFDFLMLRSGRNFKDILFELGGKLGIPKPHKEVPKRPPIREEVIKACQLNLNEEVKRYLREKRGLSDATIEKYQVGWEVKRQRNTIPVRDERGNLVNIRLYNAKKDPKIINYVDGKFKYGTPARLYGLDELVKYQGKQVILSEGEFDRLLLQQEGLMTVTSTHGCSVFRAEWVPYFKGKDVVIIYDCDSEGQAAANNIVLKAFKNSEVNSIKNIQLPLKGSKDDKDITDYFHKRGSTASDLQRMIDESPIYKYEEETQPEEIIRLKSFTEIERKELIDKKVQCEITVCGETSEAFHAVEEFEVTFCAKLKKGECFDCAEPIRVPRGAREFIGSCMTTDVQVTGMLRAFCCKYGQRPAIKITKRITIKEFFCHQRINRISHTRDAEGNVIQVIDGKKQELMEKRVYYLSSEYVKPGNYLATGYVKTHPKTQQVTFLIEAMVPQEDDFQSFKLEENLEHLQTFKKLTWEQILEDLSGNVTKVYERDDILAAILLTYCSPLWLKFNGEIIRGWLVTIIMGDSGSGKSQTHSRFAEFTDIGDCFSGLTGSRTGLSYALVEHKQKGWQVRIGRYPANSRKILTVDETQFLPDWDLRTISKAMEEGFLQIDRVSTKGYESMTRLIMICNPKKDRIMDTYSFGCESLKWVFPPTIIRRVDLAIFANTGDLPDPSIINRGKKETKERRITPEMLRAVIYWIWNLKPEQVIFTSEAEELCFEETASMSAMYGHATDVPLVPPSDFRNILARISAAVAAVLLSTNEAFSRLIIERGHVRMAAELLKGIYSHDNCQLDDYSEIQRQGSQLVDYESIEKAFLDEWDKEKRDFRSRGFFTKAMFILRATDTIRREDLAEQTGCSVETLRNIVRLLRRFNLIFSTQKGYHKKPKFNKFIRRFLKKHPKFFESVIPGNFPDEED